MKIFNLPDDLESEILFRVPAKSLAKLKTTCKRWYALSRDPRFVKKNKSKSPRETMLLSNFVLRSIGEDLNGIHNMVDQSIKFSGGKLRSLKDSEKLEISKITHCDGLILCSTKGDTRLVVWNPCTGQTRLIKPRTRRCCEDSYDLGYVVNSASSSSAHSYKILRSCSYQNGSYENDQKVRVSEFEMYEFSSDSWRVLDIDRTCDYGIFCNGVSLKGDTYWVAGHEETGFFLVKFDFTTETFVRLPLPFQCFDLEDTTALSVVRDEKLSVLHQNMLGWSIVMKIWLTNKIDEEAKDLSWSSFVLEVDFNIFNLTYFPSFLLDEENKKAVCCDVDVDDGYKTRAYIIGEDMYKEIHRDDTKGSHDNWPLLLTYVPSLVLIPEKTAKRRKKRRLV